MTARLPAADRPLGLSPAAFRRAVVDRVRPDVIVMVRRRREAPGWQLSLSRWSHGRWFYAQTTILPPILAPTLDEVLLRWLPTTMTRPWPKMPRSTATPN